MTSYFRREHNPHSSGGSALYTDPARPPVLHQNQTQTQHHSSHTVARPHGKRVHPAPHSQPTAEQRAATQQMQSIHNPGSDSILPASSREAWQEEIGSGSSAKRQRPNHENSGRVEMEKQASPAPDSLAIAKQQKEDTTVIEKKKAEKEPKEKFPWYMFWQTLANLVSYSGISRMS